MGQKQLVSFSLVWLAAIAAVFTSQARAEDLCNKAENVTLCRSVVKGESDPIAAFKVAVRHLILETKQAKKSIAQRVDKPCMSTCEGLMNNAILTLEQTFNSLKINDKGTVSVQLSAARTYYGNCDDAVIELHMEKVFPDVIKTDAKLVQLATNCIHLSRLIKYGVFHPPMLDPIWIVDSNH